MVASVEDAELIGQSLGAFRLTGLIGAGGMGHVYRAEHEFKDQVAAVKVLLPTLTGDDKAVQRFFREAMLTSQLDHPGLPDVYAFGTEADGTAYLAMELLEGKTLSDRLREDGRFLPERAISVGSQIAGVLATTHGEGVVHRDLKPANIFLTAPSGSPGELNSGTERVKLLDFGVAKLADVEDERLTISGMILGTPVYMSPEQCSGGREVSPAADVYSLGCVLYRMLAGRPPFVCEGMGDYIVAHCTRDPPTVPSISKASSEFCELIDQMLAKAPSERPSADEVQLALETIPARDDGSRSLYPLGDDPTEIDSVTSAELAGTGSIDILIHTAETSVEGPNDRGLLPTLAERSASQSSFHTPLRPVAPEPIQPRTRSPVWIGVLGLTGVALIIAMIIALQGNSNDTNAGLEDSGARADAGASQNTFASGGTDASVSATADASPTKPVVRALIDAGGADATPTYDAQATTRIVIRSKPEGASVKRKRKGKSLGVTPLVLEVSTDELPLTLWLDKRSFQSRKIVVTAGDERDHSLRRRTVVDPLKTR